MTAAITRWTLPKWRSRSPEAWPSRRRWKQANPVLLEPIMNVEIYAPQEYAGALTGDLTSRRGRLQGMDMKRDMQIIKAQVPMAEMVTYAPVLTSVTGGRGSYHMEFSHYDEVPAHIAQKIIEEANKDKKAGGRIAPMYPKILDLGPITIHTYGLLLAAAFIAGIWITSRNARKAGNQSGFNLEPGA